MPLVIEDGSGIADANTYVDAEQAREFASDRGITLPAAVEGVDPVEPWLILAADYLESLAYIYMPATTTQGLSWPRKIDASAIDTIMSDKLLKAQCQLVIEQSNGVVLLPTTKGGADGQFIVREKVDVIETQYSEKLGTLSTPTMYAVNSLLRGLVVAGGGFSSLRTVRV